MTYEVKNLPTKKSGIELVPHVTENGNIHILTSEGWLVCDIASTTPKGIASDIATIIRLARDIGYQQAQQDIRNALGV